MCIGIIIAIAGLPRHIHVLINLLGLSVSLQHASENTCAPHPDNLDWQTGVRCTLAFTMSSVTTLALSGITSVHSGARMNSLHYYYVQFTTLETYSSTWIVWSGKGLNDNPHKFIPA